MSTRSNIAVLVNGKIKVVYCHFDGYPEGVGQTLMEHYRSQEKAESIVNLGDLSILRESVECPEGHSYETSCEGYSVFYGRDRGEEDTEAREFNSWDECLANAKDSWAEYVYFWKEDQWLVHQRFEAEGLRPLIEIVEPTTDNDKLITLKETIESIDIPELDSTEAKKVLFDTVGFLNLAKDQILTGLPTL